MNELAAKIEAILFLSAKAVPLKQLEKLLEVTAGDVAAAVDALVTTRNIDASGVHVVVANGAVELASNPAFGELMAKLSKEEVESELTRPQLETLTIIGYRGPVTKPEIEHIRGVNCTLILRNLLMRGLIVEKDDPVRLQQAYTLSSDTLRNLGLHGVEELPNFDAFNKNEKISRMLDAMFTQEETVE